MPTKQEKAPKKNRKTEIVEAAMRLLHQRGLTGVTTRAIAEEVPCSEGAIYVHFSSRVEVLLAVLEESLPAMLVPLQKLTDSVGKQTPERNLIAAMRGLQSFHERVGPMVSSLFADPWLLQSFQQNLGARMKGPRGGIGRIAQYIEAEQRLGRISSAVKADTVASILMSTSFFTAFSIALTKQPPPGLEHSTLIRELLQ